MKCFLVSVTLAVAALMFGLTSPVTYGADCPNGICADCHCQNGCNCNSIEQVTADQRCVNGVCYNRLPVADGAVTLHVSKNVTTTEATDTCTTTYRFPRIHHVCSGIRRVVSGTRSAVRAAIRR